MSSRALLLATLLAGCAGPDRSGELLDTWHACIVSAVNQLDDGKTDPMSVAYGVQPRCAGYYQQVVQAQVAQMLTENSQIAQRQFVQSQELKLITNQVLSHRTNRR